MSSLTLIANPGSASRKYALYEDNKQRLALHFEYVADEVICTVTYAGGSKVIPTKLRDVATAAKKLEPLLREHAGLVDDDRITRIGLRVVAPSSFFLKDRLLDDAVLDRLEAAKHRAPLHITATLEEAKLLRQHFPSAILVGISDSAFHATKPTRAWNYGLPIHDADRLDIKRFGYHGLSVESVVHTLKAHDKLPPKIVVCHLGSGDSVTAVGHGKSVDTTMGYSPLEGLIMATRSGNLDATATQVLQDELQLGAQQLDEYLNHKSGLLGLSNKSSDIRELLALEDDGDPLAKLALETYVYNAQKAVGQMTAALGGIDLLVFTGTVGERSAAIRDRILHALHYLDLLVDDKANKRCDASSEPVLISRPAHSKPIFVLPAREADEMARHVQAITA